MNEEERQYEARIWREERYGHVVREFHNIPPDPDWQQNRRVLLAELDDET